MLWGWNNNIQNHNQYLIGAGNTATQEYSGTFGVSLNVQQRGAWYIGGNSGTALTNNTGNSLAIGWGNRHTGLFDRNGLTLGTATTPNTTNANDDATARLDVFAPGFDAFPSGVRFRQLPLGEGTLLVIDANGYVYDSGLAPLGNGPLNGAAPNEAERIDELQRQVEALTKKVEALMALNEATDRESMGSPSPQPSFEIYPNPTGGEITVRHDIPEGAIRPQLIIVDLTGQEISRTSIDCFGECTSTLRLPDFLNSGTYFCTLHIDDTTIATQPITYSK